MNKTKQFSVKGSYVSPDVKIAAMRTRRAILNVSNPYNQVGLRDLQDDDVEDNTNDWGL